MRIISSIALLFAFCVPAYAQDLSVTAVQWVQGNDEIPHPAVNGLNTMLQAIAEGGACNGNYTYRWDINGDGDYDDPNEGNRNASSGGVHGGYFAPLGLDIRFPDVQGDTLVFPKVEVTCAGVTASTTMPVQIRVQRLCPSYPANNNCAGDQNLSLTRRWKADRAVDRALWYMFIRFTHVGNDAHGHNVHTCHNAVGTPHMYAHGHAMNAFLRRGHGHGAGRDGDVYYRHLTQCGLNGLLSTYGPRGGLYFDDNDNLGTNGSALQGTNGVMNPSWHWASYGSSAWVEPLASFGDGAYVAPAGPAGVFGQNLRHIGQDLADGLVQAMRGDGGWHYSAGNGGGGTNDASTNGWAGEALRLLERKYDVETYDWAKDRQRGWLNRVCANGRCLYHSNDARLSGNALVGYGWTEDEEFTRDGQGGNLGRHLDSVQANNHVSLGLYYMYASTKGLRSFDPEIRYLPNGRDWASEFTDFLLQQQAADGSWSWAGGWPWAGGVNTHGRTAMITQIIQSWLEVSAYARATPELAGPGIDITFDHSWSYILDPIVTMSAFRWNVIDYPTGLDANEDGDFEDEGDFPPEDANGNGRVDDDEIVWDFETDDINEPFVYAYALDLDWDDVVDFNVTLEVEDSNGRTVQDQDSVRVEVSLRNHRPVIIPHPNGLGARYRGYVGTQVVLDGRASYDVDEEHDVFPGDDERDPGIQDRITSIHFDLNLDGDFDDEGEDGLNGTVRMTLREGQGEGDVLAVPMRVCDDGQWNGKCYDGVQRADCSECSYGSAPILLLENVDPPEIVIGGPYAPRPGDSVQLDLSGSSDPEGVLGLRYLYSIIEGRGSFTQSAEYEDIENDMGPDVTYDPDPDGPRVDRLLVRVFDAAGAEARAEIRVAVANIPPVVDGWDLRFEGAPPVVGDITIVNRGNGRYRASIEAAPSRNVNTWIDWSAHDAGGDDLRMTVDLDPNDEIDLRGDGADGSAGPFPCPGGQAINPDVQILDDADSTQGEEREIRVPAADPTLRYYFDLGNDGVFEIAGGGSNWFEFDAPPGAEQVVIAGYVRGAEGDPTVFEQEVPLRNANPVFEDARVLSQVGFDVVVSARALDPDGDDVTYIIDWGDGSEPTRNRGGLAAHTYPDGQFRAYEITITVEDGAGGSVARELDVEFEAPAANRPPTIAEIRIIKEGGFDVLVVVSANDPDNDPLRYELDWGDGGDASVVFNGIAAHTFPDAFRAWGVRVTVTDGRGGRAQQVANVNFPAPQANRAPRVDALQLVKEGGFRVVAVAAASDPDDDPITFSFDWGDDSEPSRSAGGIAAHTYPDGVFRAYTVTVTVSDGRDGTGEFEQEVNFPRPPANRDPVVEGVRIIRQGEWELLAVVGAIDPDGDSLEFTIDWGDDSEPTVNRGGIAPHAYPENVYRAYTIRVSVDDGRGGTAEGETEFNFPEPEDNAPPIISDVSVSLGARGQATLTVDAADPEGRALTYRVHWGDEDAEDGVANLIGGQGSHRYELAEDGAAYAGWVVVRDDLGNEAREAFQVRVQDSPTIVRDFSVNVIRDGTVLISVVAEDRDGDDFLVYSFDFTDDGEFDVNNQADSSIIHSFPEAGEYGIRVRITDTWSGNSITEVARIALDPWVGENGAPVVIGAEVTHGGRGRVEVVVDAWDPEGRRLTYRIHWGDEDDPAGTEVLVGGFGDHRYGAPSPEDEPFAAYVDVTDVAGSTTRHQFEISVVDFPTEIRNVSANIIREGTVLVSVLAEDGDGRDALLYSYDFDGDGEWELEDLATDSVVHSYDGPGDYTIIVGVRDPWTGALVQAIADVRLDPWAAENAAPVIHDLRLLHGPRGLITLAVDASDPEGGAVDLVVHWGDEAEDDALAPLAGLGTQHRYAFPIDADAGPYRGFVRATDRQGASVEREFNVRIVDAPTMVRAISVSRVEGGTYLFDVLADDGDGADQLRYDFDFDGDGDFEITGQVSSSTIYGYGAPGLYDVDVMVTDTWSGAITESSTSVDVAPWEADNRPPMIHDIEVSVGARGLVGLVVDAEDPDGGRLSYEVHWGDEADDGDLAPLPGGAGAHTYAWRDDDESYIGYVVVTDNAGATAESDFDVKVFDSPTVIREISLSILRDGTVLANVTAADPDSDALLYGFDFLSDGSWQVSDSAESSAVHEYDEAGAYTLTVSVTDPWSGSVTSDEHDFELDPWEGDSPIADDHLEGEEGFCLVFRIGDDVGDLSTKVDPAACERANNPGEELYRWDFGDGTMGAGTEVGHRYADDGIYEVVIRGGSEGRPTESRIQVLIANVAPAFLTQPPVVATPGEVYEYTLRLEDPGSTDQVRVILDESPDGMTLQQSADSDRVWTVRWDVPADFAGRQVEVALRAIDGHGAGDIWTNDGGDTLQAFFVTLGGGGGGNINNGSDADGGVDAGATDDDGGIGLDEFTGSSCTCDVRDGAPGLGFALFLGLLAIGRRRRR